MTKITHPGSISRVSYHITDYVLIQPVHQVTALCKGGQPFGALTKEGRSSPSISYFPCPSALPSPDALGDEEKPFSLWNSMCPWMHGFDVSVKFFD